MNKHIITISIIMFTISCLEVYGSNCPSFWSRCYVKSVVSRDINGLEDWPEILRSHVPKHEDYYIYSMRFGIKSDESATGFRATSDVDMMTIVLQSLENQTARFDGVVFNAMQEKGYTVVLSEYIDENDFMTRKYGNEYFAEHEPVLLNSYNLWTFNCQHYAEGMYAD